MCSVPNNINEVSSLLGMTNYVSRFIRDYSTITEPIARLMKGKTEWQWSDEQEKAIQKLISTLTS